MASNYNPLQNLALTPQQQDLLFAALNSNKAAGGFPKENTMALSAANLDGSLVHTNHGLTNFLDGPLLDYDYDFNNADSSFDFSFNDTHNDSVVTDKPEAPSTTKSDSVSGQDSPDKRGHPDDEDDEESGAKRRESEDKVSKKPGRKPLTTEPTSKRKAQNRAAQRAFRERKEKHLKDLETKVEELQKASEEANNENQKLRSQVEKMTAELNEYKKRVGVPASTRSPMTMTSSRVFGTPMSSSLNDVNFQFEFPKFGVLPGTSATSNHPSKPSPPALIKRSSSDKASPSNQGHIQSPGQSSTYSQIGLDSQAKDDLAHMATNMFHPVVPNSNVSSGSRTSFDSHSHAGTSHSSPSDSSASVGGPSSSCGTSPEPYTNTGLTQSPAGFKPLDTMTTIGEESANLSSFGHDTSSFVNMNNNDFNWLPQNNFQFDPQLFGDYRDPSDNLLSGVLDDSLFNDVIDADFITPYNLPLTVEPKKPDLIAQIDEAKNTDKLDSNGQLLTCNKIWEKLQNCPKVQNGDFDLDGLCSELQKKAKCSGSGAVVDEGEFRHVMKKYLGSTDKEISECDIKADRQEAERKALGEHTA
jgi:AP-1-like factor